MKIIVTGGAGFIGSHIVDACLQSGHNVEVIDDLSSGLSGNVPEDIPLHKVDIRNTQRIADIFQKFQPDAVCHQAAQLSVSRSVRDPLWMPISIASAFFLYSTLPSTRVASEWSSHPPVVYCMETLQHLLLRQHLQTRLAHTVLLSGLVKDILISMLENTDCHQSHYDIQMSTDLDKIPMARPGGCYFL